MLRINPDKAFTLLPVKCQIASSDQPLPDNWLHLLGEELIKHLNFQLESAKAEIHQQLNGKVGEAATYTHKEELLKILARLYFTLINEKTLPSQQAYIAMKLVEGYLLAHRGFTIAL
jgi:hypothetical protein